VVLLNTAGITSNPATHQAPLAASGAVGQLGRQQHGLRHARQPDCGLLQRALWARWSRTRASASTAGHNHVLARSDTPAWATHIVQRG